MIDSHCHLDLADFDEDREDIIEQSLLLDISRMLVPGLSVEQFPRILALHKKYKNVDIAFGLHPFFLTHGNDAQSASVLSDFDELVCKYSAHIVAIGECGLDAKIGISIDYQKRMLAHQIETAKAFKLPLILHHRQSHNLLIQLLKQHRFSFGGVIHAFSGSLQIANTYIDMGFCLGVGGTITYPRAIKTRNTISAVGLEHILLETDAPTMPVFGYQGQRNSPSQLPLIAKSLVELKHLTLDAVKKQTDLNYQRVFKSQSA